MSSSGDTTWNRPARERVLGVDVDRVELDELAALVTARARDHERLWVAHHNLHSAYLVLDDDDMQAWYQQADIVFVDGMSLVLASRLTGGRLRRVHRATLLDWMPSVLDAAARDGTVVFHLGGHPDWIERGAAAWRARHPGLELHVHHGYFGPTGTDSVLAEVERVGPSLLLVGMGMPEQERWLAAHATSIAAPVIVTVGAFLGYAAGATATPPRWTGRLGLEWAWRLAADPRRLARRYLVEPLSLAVALRRRGR